MSGSVNKVTLIGHLGKDPEIRTVGSGDKVVNLTLATSEKWRDKSSGEQREKTQWHKIVIWNEHLVKVAENYLKKGSLVYIEGALETRKYDKDGTDVYITEVVLQKYRGELTMLGSKPDGGGRRDDRGYDDDYSSGFSTGGSSRPSAPKESYDLNDDIPF